MVPVEINPGTYTYKTAQNIKQKLTTESNPPLSLPPIDVKKGNEGCLLIEREHIIRVKHVV